MFEKEIDKLNPKPRFNLRWYGNNDKYSDGDVENDIINIIVNSPVEDYSHAIYNNFSWAAYYHLTNLRQNLLNWYSFSGEAEVLEIGCGMGAITNLLCERCRFVTAVELSRRRATATLLRCRERENLEIIVGNLNDIQFDKKYDYITLIGVLEYQGHYTKSDNPFCDFLTKIRGLLKPGGKLLVAIENKYGLKYWCGAREDHTGVPFDGINQYAVGNQVAYTFSKKELSELLTKSGFGYHYFYYPMPDYKLPRVVYSEEMLPEPGNMENFYPYYVPDKGSLVIDEKAVYDDLIKNNVFEFFANSFLVECKVGTECSQRHPVFACMSSERKKRLRVGTVIFSDRTVEKFSLENEEENGHISQIGKNLSYMREQGLKVIPFRMDGGKMIMDYRQEETVEKVLVQAYREKDYNKIWTIYDKLMSEIDFSSAMAQEGDNILSRLGIESAPNADYGRVLANGNLDMILRNCFLVGDEWQWYDQEWIAGGIPAKYIFYRGLCDLYSSYKWLQEILPISVIWERYQVTEFLEPFSRLEKMFAYEVQDIEHWQCSESFRRMPENTIKKNINKLLARKEGTAGDIDLTGFRAAEREIRKKIDDLLRQSEYEVLADGFSKVSRMQGLSPELKVFARVADLYNLQKEIGQETIFRYGDTMEEIVAFYEKFTYYLLTANEYRDNREREEWTRFVALIEKEQMTAYELIITCAYIKLSEMEVFVERLGSFLYESGNITLAVQILMLYLDIYEEADEIALDLAYIFFYEGDLEQAGEYLQKVKTQSEYYTELYRQLSTGRES